MERTSFMIPGWFISILTFPGVIVHEFAHKVFCDTFGVRVIEVCYFRFGNPAGYVIHERPDEFKDTFWIGVGPLLVNSAAAILTAGVAASSVSQESLAFLVFLWLALSFGAHSFPSNEDVQHILAQSKEVLRAGGTFLHYLSYPFVFLIWLANGLRFFWIDFVWALLLVGVGFALAGETFDAWSEAPSQESATTQPTVPAAGGVAVGSYLCSDFHAEQARRLEPPWSEAVALLDKEAYIKRSADLLLYESEQIDRGVADPYSEDEVSRFNHRVDRFNESKKRLEDEIAAHEKSSDAYNASVDTYNNYLEQNCEPAGT